MTLRPRLALWAILGLGAAVYAVGLKGPLVLDDYVSVVNTRVESGGWQAWLEQTTRHATGPLRRPLSYLSFALNAQWAMDGQALRVWPYKLVNLVIHLLNAVLVWMLVARLGRAIGQERAPRETAAALAAGFWALHPLQVSTVLYVVQRMTLLATTMTLLAILVFVVTHRNGSGWRRPLMGGFGIVLLTLTGVLFKEIALLTPLLLAATYAVIANGDSGGDPRLRWYRAAVIGLPITAGLLLAAARPGLVLGGYGDYPFSPVERLMTEAHVVLDYLRVLVLPRPGLMAFHMDQVALVRELDAATTTRIVALAGLALLAVLLRRRRPLGALGIAWFLLAHTMESSILPLELAYEHRNYLPSVGVALVFADVVSAVGRIASRRRLVLIGASAVVLALAALTGLRAYQWSSPYLLNYHHFRYLSESPRAIVDLMGLALAHRDLEGARVLHRRLEAVEPLDPRTGLLRLHLACILGEIPSRQMLAMVALQMEQGWIGTDALSTYQQLVERQRDGLCPRLPGTELVTLADQAVAQPSVFRSAASRRGWLQSRAVLLAGRGEFDRALNTLNVAADGTPDNSLLLTRAEILLKAGRHCAAAQVLRDWPATGAERMLRPRATIARLSERLPKAPCGAED